MIRDLATAAGTIAAIWTYTRIMAATINHAINHNKQTIIQLLEDTTKCPPESSS